MAILIDPPSWPGHQTVWSHLVSDSSVDELHAFALGLGLPRRRFDADHYDVPASQYEAAIAAGAEPVSGRELLGRLHRAGLRVPKRKGEWLVDSRPLDPAESDAPLQEMLTSPFDMHTRLEPGGRVHVLDLQAATLTVVDRPVGVPAGFVRLRTVGSRDIVVTDLLYDVTPPGARLADPAALTAHPLWPLVARLISRRPV